MSAVILGQMALWLALAIALIRISSLERKVGELEDALRDYDRDHT